MGKDSSNQNVDPTPGSLVAPMRPSMRSISCFDMDNPKPVPPNSRVIDASAWLNRSKIRANCSGAMPIPSSTTSTCSKASSPVRATQDTDRVTFPSCVNLTALPARFINTCRIRPSSPTSRVTAHFLSSTVSLTRCTSARFCKRSATPRNMAQGSKGTGSMASFPVSIFEKSRISLMIESRPLAESVMVFACKRCSSSRFVSMSSDVMPMTPFSGVRIS